MVMLCYAQLACCHARGGDIGATMSGTQYKGEYTAHTIGYIKKHNIQFLILATLSSIRFPCNKGTVCNPCAEVSLVLVAVVMQCCFKPP